MLFCFKRLVGDPRNVAGSCRYGPLVLAGINMTTDIWVPQGGTEVAKTRPAAFIRRISNSTLEFEATGAESSIRLIPLKEVMDEKCVDHQSWTKYCLPVQIHILVYTPNVSEAGTLFTL